MSFGLINLINFNIKLRHKFNLIVILNFNFIFKTGLNT